MSPRGLYTRGVYNGRGATTPSATPSNPVTGTATANPVTFGSSGQIIPTTAARGQYAAQQSQDRVMSEQAGVSKGYTPPATQTPAMTAQERELAAIEKAAKGRLATANTQSDIQRAAMLQNANERIHSQGLDPTSNAAWSMQQRAVDQAGIEGNQIVNSALNQNTEAMLAEQDQITQRENSISDENRAEKLSTLRWIMENSSKADQRTAAANELSGLIGMGGTVPGSGVDLASAFDTETGANDKAASTRLTAEGIAVTPENIAQIQPYLGKADEATVLAMIKEGTFDDAKYKAGNKLALDYTTNVKSASDLNSADWTQLNQQQKSDILRNTAIVREGNTSYNTWDNVGQGDVVANQGKAYKVVYNPEGKGVYVESLDKPGTYMYFSSDHPGGRKTTLEDINKRYNKRHGAGWSLSGYSSGPNKSFSSVV